MRTSLPQNIGLAGPGRGAPQRRLRRCADAPIWATLRRAGGGVLRWCYAWPPTTLRGEKSAFGHLRSQGGDVGDLLCLDHLAIAEVSDHRLIYPKAASCASTPPKLAVSVPVTTTRAISTSPSTTTS